MRGLALLEQAARAAPGNAEIGGHLRSHRDARHVMTGVLLQMKLATLPRHSGKARFPSCLQPAVIIADNEPDTVQSAVLQLGEKIAPMQFGLAQGHTHAQQHAMAVWVYSHTNQDRTGNDGATMANFLIPRIQHHIGDLA